VLTEDDIENYKRIFERSPRNFTTRQWRDIAAALPPGPKGRDMFFYSFLVAANDYWTGMATTPTTKHSVRRLDKLLKDARADLKRERKLAPERAAALFEMGYFDMKWPGRNVESARFHRHSFLIRSVMLWEFCGGETAFSRDKGLGTPTGPLIRYLSLVCNLVMGKEAPALETLAAFIQRYRS
jgi:hypothetical protein